MLAVEKLAILHPEIEHTFVLNASNAEDIITKDYLPKFQVQDLKINECILGTPLANNGIRYVLV